MLNLTPHLFLARRRLTAPRYQHRRHPAERPAFWLILNASLAAALAAWFASAL